MTYNMAKYSDKARYDDEEVRPHPVPGHFPGRLLFAILVLIVFIPNSFSQKLSLAEKEQELSFLFDRIRHEKQDQRIKILNDSVLNIFQTILHEPQSFTWPFDSLRYVGLLYPPDSSFRLINWNLALSNGNYRYFGFVLLKDSMNQTSRVIRLEDNSSEIRKPEDTILTPSCWYGALYYKILLNTWQGQNYYTLLGIDFHDLLTTRKVIDVITFDKQDHIFFGAPMFDTGKGIRKRIIFEFSSQVSMMLHYDKRLHMIVFDHLSPSRPAYEGIYQFYGPDSSYDGFVFYGGMWHLKKDLDLRNTNE